MEIQKISWRISKPTIPTLLMVVFRLGQWYWVHGVVHFVVMGGLTVSLVGYYLNLFQITTDDRCIPAKGIGVF